MTFVGVDIGTSSVKAVVTDAVGRVIGHGASPTPWTHRGGGTEADPDRLVVAARHAIGDAVARAGGPVLGLGVTGMAESGVLIDDAGRPCAPIIAWHDDRGSAEEAELRARIGDASFGTATGQRLSHRLSAVKYAWLRRCVGGRAGLGRWLTTPEWLVTALGGSPGPELSQWSRTGFVDIETGGFLPVTCDWAGLPWRDLPPAGPAGTPAGTVSGRDDLRGLRGARLTTAGHDHITAAFGAGVQADADVCDSWGNGEALVRATTGPLDVAAALGRGFSLSWHVMAGRRALFLGLGSGLMLRQVLAALGSDGTERDELDRRAADLEPGPRPTITILPSGAVDAIDTASWAPEATWRAALDTAFARVRTGIAALEDGWGPVERVVGCGGWLQSEPLRRLKGHAVPRFEAHTVSEPAAVGAALLAARAAGVVPSGSATT